MSSQFISGVLFTTSVVITLYFVRFWRKTRDRLFLYFGAAFMLMALNRGALSLVADESETRTYLYVVRLIAFVIIIVAIVDKNRAFKQAAPPPGPSPSAAGP